MRHKKNILPALLLSFMAIILFGCGGGGDSGSASASSDGGSGTLSLHLTDATTLDYRAVYVTIDRVDVHMGENNLNGGTDTWKTVATPAATYNLLELVNGVTQKLGLSELESGHYTQMRLILGDTPDGGMNILGQPHPSANYLIMADTNDTPELETPSAQKTGIKLVRPFTIKDSQLTRLFLDFDASRSIVNAGNSKWLLKPTIKVLDTIEMGIIEGLVVDDNGDALGNALVSSQISDLTSLFPSREVLIEAASPTDDGASSDGDGLSRGEFSILVQPGTYNIVAGKPGYTTAVQCSIIVSAGEVVLIEDLSLNALEENGANAYATLTVEVDLQTAAYAAISIRSEACGAKVEVTADRISDGGVSEFLLPAGDYDIVAWDPDSQLELYQDTVVLDAGAVTSVSIEQ
ncbi:DUF4382 domain-containing protein [Desulfatitalea alkaliphila]|uniref:DUF4382 domain-containing protein n=1 Tax=Desulfatitalea alkaliphila TaxID=2929485 RepID=A0AA41R122_9BACT|nr:DUF4382 domain-containing protein [Desulfatitalea alkaliphila]MCJ8500034.1 DUF4382 domain-containing protein [Desulfatitalea alkaliphila]